MKNFKHLVLLVLALTMCLFSFTSCDQVKDIAGNIPGLDKLIGTEEEEHVHAFSDATCTAPKTCECGATEGEALGHNYVEGKCACGATDPNYVPHTHSYQRVVTKPTCTTEGYTTFTCFCGDTYTDNIVAANGHNYVNGKCDVCGETDPNYVPPHTHNFVEGKCECGETDPNYNPGNPDAPVVNGKIEITVDSLGVASNSYSAGTATIGGVNFEFIQIGNYGDGIQVRDKDGKTSMLWNTTAFKSPIVKIILVYSDTKDVAYANPDAEIFSFGTEMKGDTYTAKLSTVAGEKNYEIIPDADTYTYFYFEHDLGYTFYWKSITIVLADGTTIEPDVPGDHTHNFVEGKCECGETDPDYKPETPNESTAVIPEAGKGYIFGMTQGNLENAVYYLKGGMDGYYMATTTNPAEALLVYIEATEGGYYAYCYVDGAKTYINMVVSGTHVNGAYEATASTVYTIDEAHHTLIAMVNDTEYWFGTRNDKTYTTMGPCAVSYAGFYGEFYAVATEDDHTHNFVEGKCECGETDPTYVPSHTHNFVEGKCECGETDPTYVPPHTHNFVEGKCECGEVDPTYSPETPDEPVVNGKVEITVDSLGVASNSYSAGTATIGGVDFEFIQIGNYGDGIQVRDKDGKTSMLWNTTAFKSPIVKIILVYSDTKDVAYANPDAEIFSFGTEMKGDTYTAKLSTVVGEKTYEIVPNAETYTYFYFEHDYGYTFYWKSITIVLADGTTVEPEIPGEHTHSFVEGKCECGETDPTYVPPHTHNFVEGKCECGEVDPTYSPETPDEPGTPVVGGGSADFGTIALEKGYGQYDKTFTTTDGWSTVNAAIQAGGTTDINPQFVVIGSDPSIKAVCLNGKTSAVGKLTSPTLTGGISKLTMKYTKCFTDTKLSVTIKVTDLSTGIVYEEVVSRDVEKDNDKFVVWDFEWVLETPITGDFTIEVINNCPSASTSNKDRITILDLSWEG